MSKRVRLILVLTFFAASSIAITKPAFSAEAENSWTTKTSMPEGVSIVKTAVVNGEIYAITGSSVYEYDPGTDDWNAKTVLPTPRSYPSFGVAVYQNKIYVIGGNNGSGNPNLLSTNEVYDPATDTWENKKPMPTSREWAEANTFNDKIYVIGGVTDNSLYVHTPVNEVYDPATDSWTTAQPAPYAVIKGASAVVDDKIYILGGLSEQEDPLNARTNQVYDTETDTWSLGASLPTAMWYTAAGSTTGVMAPKRVYIIGAGFTEVYNLVYVYDPALDSWASGSPMPTNRTMVAVSVVNDIIYAMGGALSYQGDFPVGTFSFTNVVEQYTPFGYETIPHFTPEPEPFPTTLVAATSVATVIIVGAGLLVYFKKYRR